MTRYMDYKDHGDIRVYHIASRRQVGQEVSFWQMCIVVRTLCQMA